MARLELDHLSKRYGRSADTAAVNDLSLTVNDGEFVCLLGPSGCGKTTTLRMIGGFLKPDSGDVRIDGVSILNEPLDRRPTSMVFQRYALWPHMTVWNNVAFGLQVRHRPRDEIRQRVGDTLELVGLPGLGQRYPAHPVAGRAAFKSRRAIANLYADRIDSDSAARRYYHGIRDARPGRSYVDC